MNETNIKTYSICSWKTQLHRLTSKECWGWDSCCAEFLILWIEVQNWWNCWIWRNQKSYLYIEDKNITNISDPFSVRRPLLELVREILFTLSFRNSKTDQILRSQALHLGNLLHNYLISLKCTINGMYDKRKAWRRNLQFRAIQHVCTKIHCSVFVWRQVEIAMWCEELI